MRRRSNSAVEATYTEIGKQVNVPGFRKGKAPREIVKRYIDEEKVKDRVADKLLQTAYKEALEESKLEPFAPADVKLDEFEFGKPLLFTAKVPLKPVVEIGDYVGLEVERNVPAGHRTKRWMPSCSECSIVRPQYPADRQQARPDRRYAAHRDQERGRARRAAQAQRGRGRRKPAGFRRRPGRNEHGRGESDPGYLSRGQSSPSSFAARPSGCTRRSSKSTRRAFRNSPMSGSRIHLPTSRRRAMNPMPMWWTPSISSRRKSEAQWNRLRLTWRRLRYGIN